MIEAVVVALLVCAVGQALIIFVLAQDVKRYQDEAKRARAGREA
jgi:uncharacterized integral membrane protein